ncbi:MAG: hypothetical protein KF773_43150 [Deltaproteobacteria bacterium]|nr:hypothetical protein [Deltaproteobacteria bacterium]
MKKLLFVLLFAGCMDDGKGPEDDLDILDDSKADSQRKPTDHGAIDFDVKATSAITDAAKFHAWTFELSNDARITATTSYAVKGQRRTDTVLYLYKEGPSGWGSYIARNDDFNSTPYSQVKKDLGAGRYRVLVKGHDADTRGKFGLTVGCDGSGCAPAATCLFGFTYSDIPGNPALDVINRVKVTAANLHQFSAADQAKLVRAVQQSSHTDVTTPLEALSRVDEGEVNITFVNEPAARRMFMAYEYGAGDNSYGAIFERRGDDMVSKIHDGDLEACTVKRETCLLPADWLEMRTDTASFARTATKTVTAAAQLNTLETQQALGAFRDSFDDVTSVTDGLSRIDGGKLGVHAYRHLATGRELTVVEYGAGDTSIGAIYYSGSTTRAGSINDLFIEACTFFAN